MWILELQEYSDILQGPSICLIVLNSTTEEEATKEVEELLKEEGMRPRFARPKLYNASLVKEF